MTTKTKIIIALVLVGLSIVARLVPHAWNFTPIVAMALFGSVYLGRNYAIGMVVSAMLISDIFIGFDTVPMTITIYASFLAIAALGLLLKQYKAPSTVIATSIASSVLFYVITNWAVWQFSTLYVKTFDGLMLSYTMALPFFRNMLIGDLVFTTLFFGAYELVTRFVHLSRKSLKFTE